MIEARINEYTTESFHDPVNIRDFARKFRVLPLLQDWSGGWAIRPDGEIITFSYDEPFDMKVEEDVHRRNMALYEGSKKYPELKELVPERPSNAVECPYCKGTGDAVDQRTKEYFQQEGKEHLLNTFRCYCGGLGWIPEGYPTGIY
jgi:hypothetical protein